MKPSLDLVLPNDPKSVANLHEFPRMLKTHQKFYSPSFLANSNLCRSSFAADNLLHASKTENLTHFAQCGSFDILAHNSHITTINVYSGLRDYPTTYHHNSLHHHKILPGKSNAFPISRNRHRKPNARRPENISPNFFPIILPLFSIFGKILV